MDHLLPLPKMNLVMSLPPAALMTHLLKETVSLISDIFVMPGKPGVFAWGIIRFTVFILLPFKSHDLYPSNRDSFAPIYVCVCVPLVAESKGMSVGPATVLSLSTHSGQIQIWTEFYVNNFM